MNHQIMGMFIPIIAILAVFAVPITAIITDYKRRKLITDERRAMIEKGMVPPPLAEQHFGNGAMDPASRRERSLHKGITTLLLGVGLAVAAWLLQTVLTETFMPPRVAGPMAVGAVVLASLGIGNLIYYVVSRPKAGDGSGSGEGRPPA